MALEVGTEGGIVETATLRVEVEGDEALEATAGKWDELARSANDATSSISQNIADMSGSARELAASLDIGIMLPGWKDFAEQVDSIRGRLDALGPAAGPLIEQLEQITAKFIEAVAAGNGLTEVADVVALVNRAWQEAVGSVQGLTDALQKVESGEAAAAGAARERASAADAEFERAMEQAAKMSEATEQRTKAEEEATAASIARSAEVTAATVQQAAAEEEASNERLATAEELATLEAQVAAARKATVDDYLARQTELGRVQQEELQRSYDAFAAQQAQADQVAALANEQKRAAEELAAAQVAAESEASQARQAAIEESKAAIAERAAIAKQAAEDERQAAAELSEAQRQAAVEANAAAEQKIIAAEMEVAAYERVTESQRTAAEETERIQAIAKDLTDNLSLDNLLPGWKELADEANDIGDRLKELGPAGEPLREKLEEIQAKFMETADAARELQSTEEVVRAMSGAFTELKTSVAGVVQDISKLEQAGGKQTFSGLLDLGKELFETFHQAGGGARGLFAALETLKGSVGTLALVTGGVIALGAAFAVLHAGIEEAAKAETTIVRLEGAIKRAGGNIEEDVGRIETVIAGISDESPFDEEQLRSAATTFVTITQNVTSAGKALAVASDLAAGLGTTVESAAMMLARASEGYLTNLTRMGVVSKDQAKALGAITDEAQRMNAILDVVGQKFAGAGAQALDTYEGRLRELSKAWSDLKRTIGEGFPLQLATALMEGLVTWVKILNAEVNLLKTGWEFVVAAASGPAAVSKLLADRAAAEEKAALDAADARLRSERDAATGKTRTGGPTPDQWDFAGSAGRQGADAALAAQTKALPGIIKGWNAAKEAAKAYAEQVETLLGIDKASQQSTNALFEAYRRFADMFGETAAMEAYGSQLVKVGDTLERLHITTTAYRQNLIDTAGAWEENQREIAGTDAFMQKAVDRFNQIKKGAEASAASIKKFGAELADIPAQFSGPAFEKIQQLFKEFSAFEANPRASLGQGPTDEEIQQMVDARRTATNEEAAAIVDAAKDGAKEFRDGIKEGAEIASEMLKESVSELGGLLGDFASDFGATGGENFGRILSSVFQDSIRRTTDDLTSALGDALTSFYREGAFTTAGTGPGGIPLSPESIQQANTDATANAASSLKKIYAGIAAVGAVYSSLTDGSTQGLTSFAQDAVNYAALGAQIGGAIGAIIGIIVAGIIQAFKKDATDLATTALFYVKGGQAQVFPSPQMGVPQGDIYRRQLQDKYDELFNTYTNILLMFPDEVIPKLIKSFNETFSTIEFHPTLPAGLGSEKVDEINAAWNAAWSQFLAGELPQQMAEAFRPVLEAGFAEIGVSAERFAQYWTMAKDIDPAKAQKFWSDLISFLTDYQNAVDAMANIQEAYGPGRRAVGLENLNLTNTGEQREQGQNDFIYNLGLAEERIHDLGLAIATLTGPEQVAMAQKMGASVAQVMTSLIDYLNVIAQIAKGIGEDVQSRKYNAQMLLAGDDKNKQLELINKEYDRIKEQLAHATELGLNPEDVQRLYQQAADLAGQAFALEPTQEAFDLYSKQLDFLAGLAKQQLEGMATQAQSEVDKLLEMVRPFAEYLQGVPVDLQPAFDAAGNAIVSFADALQLLADRIAGEPGGSDYVPPGPGGPGTERPDTDLPLPYPWNHPGWEPGEGGVPIDTSGDEYGGGFSGGPRGGGRGTQPQMPPPADFSIDKGGVTQMGVESLSLMMRQTVALERIADRIEAGEHIDLGELTVNVVNAGAGTGTAGNRARNAILARRVVRGRQ